MTDAAMHTFPVAISDDDAERKLEFPVVFREYDDGQVTILTCGAISLWGQAFLEMRHFPAAFRG